MSTSARSNLRHSRPPTVAPGGSRTEGLLAGLKRPFSEAFIELLPRFTGAASCPCASGSERRRTSTAAALVFDAIDAQRRMTCRHASRTTRLTVLRRTAERSKRLGTLITIPPPPDPSAFTAPGVDCDAVDFDAVDFGIDPEAGAEFDPEVKRSFRSKKVLSTLKPSVLRNLYSSHRYSGMFKAARTA